MHITFCLEIFHKKPTDKPVKIVNIRFRKIDVEFTYGGEVAAQLIAMSSKKRERQEKGVFYCERQKLNRKKSKSREK